MFSLQNAQLTRPRIYNDADQQHDLQPPKDAPRWTHIQQADNEIVSDGYDSIFDAYNNDDHNNDDHNNDYNDDFTYWFDEEPQAGETSTAGMIRGALANDNQNEKKVGSKKGKEKEKVSKRLHILRLFNIFRY